MEKVEQSSENLVAANAENWSLVRHVAMTLLIDHGAQKEEKNAIFHECSWSSVDSQTQVRLVAWRYLEPGEDVATQYKFVLAANKTNKGKAQKSEFIFRTVSDRGKAAQGTDVAVEEYTEEQLHEKREYSENILGILRTHPEAQKIEDKRTFRCIFEVEQMPSSIVVPAASHDPEIIKLAAEAEAVIDREAFETFRADVEKLCQQRYDLPPYFAEHVMNLALTHPGSAIETEAEN